MLSRRDLVGRLTAGTAMLWAAAAARTSFASVRTEANAPVGGAYGGDRPAPASPPAAPDPFATVIDSGPPETLSAPAPWDLVRPLAIGSMVAHGWRVAGLTGVVDGSSVLTLENQRGRTQRVHLCRNDGRPQGLVCTKRFDLVVMNGGQGDVPTDEGLAQAVAEVAHALAANEDDRQHQHLVTALLPQAERVRLFSGSVDRRLR
jgi:hypothetical protein